MTRPLADEVLDRVARAYQPARDPERAVAAAAYMRGRFVFLGLGIPAQRALGRAAVAGLPAPGEDELAEHQLSPLSRREAAKHL